jgi:Ca2+-binding EF-hand superfamily protein
MDQWDLNHDGKISRSELTMMLLQQGKLQGALSVDEAE